MDNKLYKKIGKYIKENLSFFLFVIVLFFILNARLPWSVYTPGGLINIDSRLTGDKYDVEGSFNLTYVTFIEGKIPSLILGAIMPEWDIVKNEDITYDNETLEDSIRRERLQLYQSVSNAYFVAYTHANKNITIRQAHQYVVDIYDMADTTLKVGDEIIKINDQDITSFDSIANIIASSKVDTYINLTILRDGKEQEATAKISDYNGEKKMFIGLVAINEYEKQPDINYTLKQSESGASGGLMLSLAIYNALTEKDITNGRKISGTGTISIDGKVGPIGGVKYKLSGAVKKKSDIFIAPDENYEEAVKLKEKYHYDIEIVKATTFNDVLLYLENN